MPEINRFKDKDAEKKYKHYNKIFISANCKKKCTLLSNFAVILKAF